MKIIKISILCLCLLLPAGNVSASYFLLSPGSSNVEENDSFIVTVYLSTEGEIINTIEGDLKYNAEVLDLEQVRTGGSFISFWIEKPNGKGQDQGRFSGVVPGGININKGEVFSLVFKAKTKGQANVMLDNLNLYINDGEGTKISSQSVSANIYIVNPDPATPGLATMDDAEPEEVDLRRARDEYAYDNKWFAAFNSQDKGTGISRYEVCEFWICSEAQSPYILKNQTPFYHVSVKAYDFNGNNRSSSLTSPYMLVLALPVILYGFYRRFYLKKL